jgi:glycosyltransferase involved in cell wall biosynthesis
MSACAVLHLTPVQGGGADRHVRDLAASGERAHLIWHAADRADAIESPDGSIRALDLRAIAKNRTGFARWLAAQRVGLVHLHSVGTPVRLRAAWAASALGVPTMVTLHDILFQRPDAHEVGSAAGPDPAWLALTAPCLTSAAAVLAPSRFIAEVARRAVPGLEVAVIPNGRTDSPASTALARPEFSDHNAGRVVAVLGAIGPHKGSALLRQLPAQLEGSDIVVVVIGYLDGEIAPGWRLERTFIHEPYKEGE